MLYRYRIRADAAECQQLVTRCYTAVDAIGHQRGVREVLLHRTQAHRERFFPDHAPPGESPALALVQADDVTREVDHRIGAAVAAWNIHAVHGGDAAWHRDARELAHHECVMLEESAIVVAVRQVALVAAVVIQP